MTQENDQTNSVFSCQIAGNQPLSILDNSKNHHIVVLFFQRVYIVISLTNKLGVMSLPLGSTFKEKAAQSIKGVALAATMFTAFPNAANANGAGEPAANNHPDAPVITNTSTASLPKNTQPDPCEASQNAPAHGTIDDAAEASACQAVIFYGEGIMDADLVADGLNGDGYKTLAMSGNEPGKIKVIVKYRPTRSPLYQDDLDRGRVGSLAEEMYEDRIGLPQKPDNGLLQTVSANAPESGL